MNAREFGRYQLVERLGEGGMADVYRATTSDVGGAERSLALKIVHHSHADDRAFVDALVNETRLATLLTHDNIAQIFDAGRVSGRYFVAMELVEGVDLHTLLKKTTGLSHTTMAYIAHETCNALHYAHTRCDQAGNPLRIVHRDVSPHNILLGHNGDVKLTDFGIAKANITRTQTAANIVKGTYDYMSPEHTWGENLDSRADIFSLGVVLYEMATGNIPLADEGDSGHSMKRLIDLNRLTIPPPRSLAPQLPERLDHIAMSALVRDREARYQSAEQMRRDLAEFLDDSGARQTARDDLAAALRGAFPTMGASDPPATATPAAPIPPIPPPRVAAPAPDVATPAPDVATPQPPGERAVARAVTVSPRQLWRWTLCTVVIAIGVGVALAIAVAGS